MDLQQQEEKTYVFTREVKAWGVEEGDYYNLERHMYQGGTESWWRRTSLRRKNSS